MKMYLAGEWTAADERCEVRAPYSGELVDEVPEASTEQVEQALIAAVEAAQSMRRLSAHERCQILHRAADLCDQRVDDLARTVTLEEGKPLSEAKGEVSRMPDLLRLCAYEGTQIRGETLPLDAQAGAEGKFGYTVREPCGVVVAITPFNYPALLVAHKIGPALATGNAVILKPAGQTPLSALKITEIFYEAGLPTNGLQCLTGPGKRIGAQLCADARVRKISFTGSVPVGEQITRVAGVKKLSLELGANCPMIVLPDADVEKVSEATVLGGYANAGQVCISTQRVLVHQQVYADFLDAFTPKVAAIKTGDPLEEGTRLSALISQQDAERVVAWVDQARESGARVVTGGQREGAVVEPTIVADVDPSQKISCEELFGPAVAVTPVESVEHAIHLTNDSQYGLGAGIFTQDITAAMRFAREAECGNVMINWTPLWRADLMPYGGYKNSGVGKEGPRYAVQEMTEVKTIVMHGLE